MSDPLDDRAARRPDQDLPNREVCPAGRPTGAEVSPEDLVRRSAAGEREGANELFRRYQPHAYRVAFRVLGNHADAQDALQEGFYNAFRNLHQFSGRSSFKTWLLGIVRNAALEFCRKAQRWENGRRRGAEEWSARVRRAERTRAPVDELAERELPELIRRIFKRQATERMQKVARMRKKGLSFREIAEKLGCCERTAGNEMKRLEDLVRRELAARGYSVP